MIFTNDAEYLLWAKQKFFEKGISPNEFKRTQIRDIKDILDLDFESKSKLIREREIKDLIAKQKHG